MTQPSPLMSSLPESSETLPSQFGKFRLWPRRTSGRHSHSFPAQSLHTSTTTTSPINATKTGNSSTLDSSTKKTGCSQPEPARKCCETPPQTPGTVSFNCAQKERLLKNELWTRSMLEWSKEQLERAQDKLRARRESHALALLIPTTSSATLMRNVKPMVGVTTTPPPSVELATTRQTTATATLNLFRSPQDGRKTTTKKPYVSWNHCLVPRMLVENGELKGTWSPTIKRRMAEELGTKKHGGWKHLTSEEWEKRVTAEEQFNRIASGTTTLGPRSARRASPYPSMTNPSASTSIQGKATSPSKSTTTAVLSRPNMSK